MLIKCGMRFIINSIWIGENKKSYPILKLNQIALIFSDNIYITVTDKREMLPNRCHSAQPHLEKHGITPFQQLLALFPLLKSPSMLNNFV